ncbi:amidase [Rhodanobacter sp. FW510-R12]|uniref:amidase n=1 Tax=unclassified Rhodanobacter TaxID=2621553 RepID=UPI0007A9BB1F|nr:MULTISPECIES: amidase [unclassified Rhodanobacter]KZC17575.1 amidase [Rhodanobacter sp. FW104-R8]KZC28731.1 amidase [Rhodanobacter sp. FW510-T8]KZC33145.1 amidase [Rhodanobacter sp. FW510-R10]
MNSMPPIADLDLRRASLCQLLHWLAVGRVQPQALADVYQQAIERIDPELHAYVDQRSGLLQDQAELAERRRRDGVIGRLDGIPIALKDNFDIAGWPTRAGLPGRGRPVQEDAHVVARLRASGAMLLGKTNMDEGALGAVTDNPHFGATHNPYRHGCTAGGSSGGAAAAVAAGLAVAAVGSDSLGSIRIPASYCGVYALKPTHGEISTRGMLPAARRLDAVGLLARSPDDLTVLLQVLAGYDADDARSRRRRVAFALPDWEPGNLRTGLLPDLAALGVQPDVIEVFEAALAKLPHALGELRTVDFADWDFARTRRAGLLLMEAEMLGTFAADLASTERPVSEHFRRLLGYAAGKSAADYARADRVLDAATLKMRRLFAQVDVLVLPTTPQGAFPLDDPVPDNQGDLTSFASLAGCPAVSLPMGTLPNGMPVGLQLVGARGSDLRLLELAAVCAATLDAEPVYPAIA